MIALVDALKEMAAEKTDGKARPSARPRQP